MRADLTQTDHTDRSLDEYVYGSAEVVGLMCLKIFIAGDAAAYERLSPSARRLGSAFQKVNFLRDLGADQVQLGRTYFPGTDPQRLDEATKARLLAELQDDLDASVPGINALDRRARRAVQLAHRLFGELARRIHAVPAQRLVTERISVPTVVKARLAAQVLAGQWRTA